MVTPREWERWELASVRRKVEERDRIWQRLVQHGHYDVASEAQAEVLCLRFEGVRWTVLKGERVYMGVRDWSYRVYRLGSLAWEEAPRW